ncbi:glycosyltransferase family protein [Mobilicoccus massiliensis]|uniref:hypothetical protein n=1 Tax=Mobilicoccus massiliensis TaxID=1522310 RepID=UPI0006940BBE|nr:hypothetical protein [Mobilicoccus massiliensis]
MNATPPARREEADPVVLHVVVGPARHGVTRHALGLLDQAPLVGHAVHRAEELPDLSILPPARLTHLHLTDHLLAPTAGECAERVVPLMERRAVSLTLHDLPQPADGEGRYERRRAAYAAMASRAAGVVVASMHERDLLTTALAEERLPAGGPIEVVPLPLPGQVPGEFVARPATMPRELAVFGYVYPGKGHADAVEAAGALGVALVALGELSPGHEGLGDELTRRAHELGTTARITGHLPEEDVVPTLRAAGVPVAPHRHVSASGSIGSWLAAGRRPLVPAGGYVDELDARCPGAVLRYGHGTPYCDLVAAARAALAAPEVTWLDPGVRLGPDAHECARRLARILDGWAVR